MTEIISYDLNNYSYSIENNVLIIKANPRKITKTELLDIDFMSSIIIEVKINDENFNRASYNDILYYLMSNLTAKKIKKVSGFSNLITDGDYYEINKDSNEVGEYMYFDKNNISYPFLAYDKLYIEEIIRFIEYQKKHLFMKIKLNDGSIVTFSI